MHLNLELIFYLLSAKRAKVPLPINHGGDMYKPKAKSEIAPTRGLEYINSVPYLIGLLRVLYQLLQNGIYTDKKDYLSWKK